MTRLSENAILRSQLAELEVSLQALKEENAMLRERLEIRTQHGHNLRTMLESATETERAAVVMYLYKRGGICIDVADDIGRGLHRREEEQ